MTHHNVSHTIYSDCSEEEKQIKKLLLTPMGVLALHIWARSSLVVHPKLTLAKQVLNSGHLVPWQRRQAARTNISKIMSENLDPRILPFYNFYIHFTFIKIIWHKPSNFYWRYLAVRQKSFRKLYYQHVKHLIYFIAAPNVEISVCCEVKETIAVNKRKITFFL